MNMSLCIQNVYRSFIFNDFELICVMGILKFFKVIELWELFRFIVWVKGIDDGVLSILMYIEYIEQIDDGDLRYIDMQSVVICWFWVLVLVYF